MGRASARAAGVQVETLGRPRSLSACVASSCSRHRWKAGRGSGLPPQLRPQNAHAQTVAARGACQSRMGHSGGREAGGCPGFAFPEQLRGRSSQSLSLLWSFPSDTGSQCAYILIEKKNNPEKPTTVFLRSIAPSARKTQTPEKEWSRACWFSSSDAYLLANADFQAGQPVHSFWEGAGACVGSPVPLGLWKPLSGQSLVGFQKALGLHACGPWQDEQKAARVRRSARSLKLGPLPQARQRSGPSHPGTCRGPARLRVHQGQGREQGSFPPWLSVSSSVKV